MLVTRKTKTAFLFFVLLVAFILRFVQLDFSQFYGDETKALYLNTHLPFKEFLMEQRKGPVQFTVAELARRNLLDSQVYSEGTLRLPFAVAGTLSVIVLYLFLQKNLGFWPAATASLLFSINGFFVAFSRTIQYQSFLILFGFLSIYLADLFLRRSSGKAFIMYLYAGLSGLFLGFSFLSHYDAIFFAIPLGVMIFLKSFALKKNKETTELRKVLFGSFLILAIAAAVSMLFYLPYFLGGHFEEQTAGYLKRRLNYEGQTSSLFTYWVYNPAFSNFVALVFAPFIFVSAFIRRKIKEIPSFAWFLLIWFAIPFIFFELVFSSPGTHILNYVIPLLILSGWGMVIFVKSFDREVLRRIMVGVIAVIFLLSIYSQLYVYLPFLNFGYPWDNEKVGATKNQLFLYGFPYNRGWEQVADYLKDNNAKTFYTTDNDTVGEFYLRNVARNLEAPEYFIHVFVNQEHRHLDPEAWLKPDAINEGDTFERDAPEVLLYQKVVKKKDAAELYELVKEIYIEGEKVAVIYRRMD